MFVLGLTQVSLPLLGGTLVPSPGALVVLPLDAQGAAVLTVDPVPALPLGQAVFGQAWVVDPEAVQGFAASNTVAAP